MLLTEETLELLLIVCSVYSSVIVASSISSDLFNYNYCSDWSKEIIDIDDFGAIGVIFIEGKRLFEKERLFA